MQDAFSNGQRSEEPCVRCDILGTLKENPKSAVSLNVELASIEKLCTPGSWSNLATSRVTGRLPECMY